MKHHKEERTLVLIKPDGIQRSLIGEILKRFERVGLKIAGMKFIVADEKTIEKHYTLDSNWRKNVGEKSIKAYIDKGMKPPSNDPLVVAEKVLNRLKKYLSSGPIVAIVLEGAHSVKIVRKLVGGTEPLTSDVGTIRGDYVLDSYSMSDTDDRSVRNLIHASGSNEEAENEINLWFKKDEIIKYKLIQEQILYDVNMDGIFE